LPPRSGRASPGAATKWTKPSCAASPRPIRTGERFFTLGRPGHHQFDLEGFVVSRLAAAGLTRIEALGQDTYSQPDLFFSYRRATHKSEPTYGRQISLIALPQ
jgi:copper oxidase (laccase) domain-containing protein